jgi:hypothetical protein
LTQISSQGHCSEQWLFCSLIYKYKRMLKVEFTHDMVFSFGGPNLCLLGNEEDFLQLAKAVSPLTGASGITINLLQLDFVSKVGEDKDICFISKTGGDAVGRFDEQGNLLFELDLRYWERLFKYFVFMSWRKCTYYLNADEDCLSDLDLEQECNFICSSEF